jgi:hypothetical protein
VTSRYREAVEWAKTELEPFLQKRPIEFGDAEPLHFFLMKCLRVNYGEGIPTYDQRILPFLLGFARTHRGAYDLACCISTDHIQKGTPMPPELRDFAISVLDGEFRKPAKSKLSRTFYRNVTLASTVEVCADLFDLKRTRNEVSEPLSACDAVSEAAASFGYFVTERALKDLLTHKSSEEFRFLLEAFRPGEFEVEWDLSELPGVPPPPF